jgi:hypothetical protein
MRWDTARKGEPVYNGVKVFSATLAKKRETLGERVTDWIRRHPEAKIVDKIVTQSSDAEFHCLSITLFYHEPMPARVTV